MLEFAPSDTLAGFRLHRFEFRNWGTFDQYVWVLPLGGENSLLTGDIGSGKSTIVDGLTTLLVPSQRITFNKAAGAEGKERTLASYVRGHYKSEKDDSGLSAKAVSLRDKNSYSVLLAYFHNEGYGQGVTLAIVLWLPDGQSQPERFFAVAEGKLTIKDDFAYSGSEMKDLKRQLRKKPSVTIHEQFHQYSLDFRRRLGLSNPKALDLFYQTVSLKSVGNLTDFVRHHMLDASFVQQKLDELCRDFDNLNQAHEAVRKAKAQIEALIPLVDATERHAALGAESIALKGCRESLHAYFALQKISLLHERLEKGTLELAKLDDRLCGISRELDDLSQRASDLKRSIDDNGGRRIEDLRRDVDRLSEERRRRSDRAAEYRNCCEILGLPFPDHSDAFYQLKAEARRLETELEAARQGSEQEQVDLRVERQHLGDQQKALSEELKSLRTRRSNLPLNSLELRERLCATLGIAEAELPFAGELLRVSEEEKPWEGAIERLLHSFGLSLLVPERHYAQVARYVDLTHLRSRLTYFRASDAAFKADHPADSRALAHKVQIRHDSPFHSWLDAELCRRFDFVCTDDLTDFQRLPKAITRQGQSKSGGGRHEKDDRHALDDRSRFVLGWSNQDKIKALENQREQLAQQERKILERLKECNQRLSELSKRRDLLRDLNRISDFQSIHWETLARQIAELEEEKRRIEEGCDLLRTLQAQLSALDQEIPKARERERRVVEERAKLDSRLDDFRGKLRESEETLRQLPAEKQKESFPKLAEMQPKALPDKKITVENCSNSGTEMRDWLQKRLDRTTEKIKDLESSILRQMDQYKQRYPLETREVDASIEAASEFRSMLEQLRRDDLPRHEARFKAELNERTIRGIAMLQNWLEKERGEIQAKIDTINRSLREIEYNPGTYIELLRDRTQDAEIRQFQLDTRACLGNTLNAEESELYTEQKFLQVKQLIDRFNGREGFAELDKRWTQKVTDVR
ncbi:MAG TPA: ATP-binding protein, partial [Chroococcales cyanobacterium]